MCRVFPTVTSCNLPNVGAGGGEQVDGHGDLNKYMGKDHPDTYMSFSLPLE